MSGLSELPPALRALLGTVLADRYAIEALIGVGGMAAVFRGVHTGLAREVAIKVLRPDLAGIDEVAARFDREARAASQFEHPHCVQVFDCGTSHDGLKFMVMPFLEGAELGEALAGCLPPSQAVGLTLQILSGLEHAHQHGVVHRDLKPDNIYVVPGPGDTEVLKIVDFGIAKLTQNASSSGVLTKIGTIVGTPAYMSPEQATGGTVDARADLYALGIILYQMLSGRLPFDRADTRSLLFAQVIEAPPPLPESVPPALAAVVSRLLAKEPAERFESARATALALEQVRALLQQDPTPWVRLLDEARARRRPTRPIETEVTPVSSATVGSPASPLAAVDAALRQVLSMSDDAVADSLNPGIRDGDPAEPTE